MSLSTVHRQLASYFSPGSKFSALLRTYFRSGWAFLIPYLFFYLLYAWLKWPANAAGGEGIVKGMSESGSVVSGQWSAVPPLLHVYWALHAIHAALGVTALGSWWRDAQRKARSAVQDTTQIVGFKSQLSTLSSQLSAPGTSLPPSPSALGPWPLALSSSRLALRRAAFAALPWLCLALLFYIPGVYLEWPSDPWEHLRRITEWSVHPIVGVHTTGYKSFYFFAYSWVGWLSPTHLLAWLNVYYVAICLLLAWQYYRLARAVGLDDRWSFLFVLINALTFGNSCFSFYRYYGLASTMFAQLGAIALTRIALEFARTPQLSFRSFFRLPSWFREPSTVNCPPSSAYRLLFTVVPLLALIGSNHLQGIGIAGLGICSIIVWRLLEWKRSAGWWLLGATVLLSIATILWWPRHSLIDSSYRPDGWLNVWYGFNLLTWPSPATDRALFILGAFGLVNLAAGLFLLRGNHVAGWLTVGPVIALTLPSVGLPFSNALAAINVTEIVVFHRMLFAIPCGIALATLAGSIFERFKADDNGVLLFSFHPPGFKNAATILLTGSLLVLVLMPPSPPTSSRSFHLLAQPPTDLSMAYAVDCAVQLVTQPTSLGFDKVILATAGISSVMDTIGLRDVAYPSRIIHGSTEPAAQSLRYISAFALDNRPSVLVPQKPMGLYSVLSFTGFLSQHWLPTKVALEHAGGLEFEKAAREVRYQQVAVGDGYFYFFTPVKP